MTPILLILILALMAWMYLKLRVVATLATAHAIAIENVRVGVHSIFLSVQTLDRLAATIEESTRTMKKFGLVAAANSLSELANAIDPQSIKTIALEVSAIHKALEASAIHKQLKGPNV